VAYVSRRLAEHFRALSIVITGRVLRPHVRPSVRPSSF